MIEIIIELIFKLIIFLSIINIFYVLVNLGYKMFLFFRLNQENVNFNLTNKQIILLWFSIAIILTYIF